MNIRQWTLPQRKDHIMRQIQSGAPDYQHQLNFQGRIQKLPVFTVDIGFPCYRLSNGRTLAAQKEMIARRSLPDNFFAVDPDSDPALRIQEEILYSMLPQADLLNILKRSEQTDPLILTCDGYIVNGNRRLRAMRYLLEQNPSKYAHFAHVQVVILPVATEDDIKELEGSLQVQPEGRADYTWVDEAMLFKNYRESGWTDDHIANLYKKKVKDIREKISMLEDAEVYLDSRGKRGFYSEVLKKEYAFIQLLKCRTRCGDEESKKQLFTNVAYLMLDDSGSGDGRLYESIPDAFKYLDNIVDSLKRDLKIDTSTTDSGDGLDILGGGAQDEYSIIATALRDVSISADARTTIEDTVEELRDLEREKKDATYCLRQAQSAYAKIQSCFDNLSPNSDIEGMADLLNGIEGVIQKLKEQIKNGNNSN